MEKYVQNVEKGSLYKKMVKSQRGKVYHYYYFAHYSWLEGGTRKIKWCYIGKEEPEERKEHVKQS